MPKYIVTTCPICGEEAVALDEHGTMVIWCAPGHVSVAIGERKKLVYDFADPNGEVFAT